MFVAALLLWWLMVPLLALVGAGVYLYYRLRALGKGKPRNPNIIEGEFVDEEAKPPEDRPLLP